MTTQSSSSKTSSSPSISSIWTPTSTEAEAGRDRERGRVTGRDRGPEPADAVLRGRPVEERPRRFAGDALAARVRLDAVADLHSSISVRRAMEAARPDDAARPIGLVPTMARPSHGCAARSITRSAMRNWRKCSSCSGRSAGSAAPISASAVARSCATSAA